MNRRFLLFLLSLIYVTRVGNAINVGTTLYKKHDLIRIWSEREAIRLQGRMIVDQLLPRHVPDGAAFVEYVKLIMNKSMIIDNKEIESYTRVMVADVIGGYMHSVLLFKVKASYYEGHVGFNVTNWLYGMMRKIKFVLNTDGRGWRTAAPRVKDPDGEDEERETGSPSTASTTTVDFDPDPDDDDDGGAENQARDSCAALRLEPRPPQSGDGATAVVQVPMPAFDDDREPGSLVLPFAVGRRLFAVDSAEGADGRGPPPPLVRYYRLAVRCVSAAPDGFLRDVRRWLNASVAPLLAKPRRWYPVLVGAPYVIRAAAKASGRRRRATTSRRVRSRRVSSDATTAPTAVTVAVAATTDVADDDWGSCDDGGRLPNLNVFLSVPLGSLTFAWTVLGALRGHKAVRFVFGR